MQLIWSESIDISETVYIKFATRGLMLGIRDEERYVEE
jgi:hypothetical protein